MNSQIFEDWVRKLDRKFRPFSTWQPLNLFFCPQTLCKLFSQWTKVSLEALSTLPKESCVFVMQSLGKKWNSSKDFNFTSNEGTCWFLKGRNKVNCYQLFQEDCNQMESAVIANSNYSFKELQKKIIRVKISWSINFARKCYC